MNNKTINWLLAMLMVVTVSLVAFLGYNFYNDRKAVYARNFINKNVNQVFEWCGGLSSSYSCEFIYEESKEYVKDTVFYQSVKENDKIDSKIVFKVSSGLIEEVEMLEIDENTTRGGRLSPSLFYE